jgi:hypothetical protein
MRVALDAGGARNRGGATGSSVVCGAAHKDAVTKSFEYIRSNAITPFATVAGLIRCVIERRRGRRSSPMTSCTTTSAGGARA